MRTRNGFDVLVTGFQTDFTSKREDSIGDMDFLSEGHAMRDSVSPVECRCIMAES